MHSVGAGLCSARTSDETGTRGRSRAPPLQGAKQIKITSPQKGADHQIWSVPSIDGNRSKATSCKFGPYVSGGAYQDACKVTIEWNAKPKHWGLPKIRCRKHQTVTQRPFSLPSFPARRKRRGRRRRVRNDHDGTSRRKRRLFSSVLVSSFPNRKLNLRFGSFPADLRQPLSLGCAEPASLPLLSLRDSSP